MRLLTAQLRQYIIESWKRIIINATITDGVTDKIRPSIYSRESEKNYCEYYCYFYRTNKIIDGILLVICYIYR